MLLAGDEEGEDDESLRAECPASSFVSGTFPSASIEGGMNEKSDASLGANECGRLKVKLDGGATFVSSDLRSLSSSSEAALPACVLWLYLNIALVPSDTACLQSSPFIFFDLR